MAHAIRFYQDVLKAVYENCGPIIPINPFDFVLHNHDSNYPIDHRVTEKVLTDFTEILKRDIPEDAQLDEETKSKIIEDCQQSRGATGEFADFGTKKLAGIRKNINKGVGQKEHLKVDPTEINREMVKAFFNEHVKDMVYTIDFETFDWSRIELFMIVTENFFKKLETTKDMKIHPNDAVDWFNILYVTPEDQYLTCETSWRNYILSDNRIEHYLYRRSQRQVLNLEEVNRITKKYGEFTLDEYYQTTGTPFAIYLIDEDNQDFIYQDGVNYDSLKEKCKEGGALGGGISALYGLREIDEVDSPIDVLMINKKIFDSCDQELYELLLFHEVIHLIEKRELEEHFAIELTNGDKAVGEELANIVNKLDSQIGSGYDKDHNENFGAILFHYLKTYDKDRCYQLLNRAMIKNFLDDYTETYIAADK